MEVGQFGIGESILRIHQVMAICGKSRAAIYKDMHKGLIPWQVKLSGRSVGWSRKEFEVWIEQCKQVRDSDV